MSNNEIVGINALKRQISHLKAERSASEEVLTQSFGEMTQLIFKPAKTIKNELSKKQGIKRDLISLSKVILNLGTNYLIERSFGRRQKLNVLLTTIMVELVSIPLINKGITKLFTGIDRHIFGETESTN
jgi:hypothetical protein